MAAKKTVLLVDDDEDLREALAEQFELHDSFETIQAANANEGIDAATTQHYHVGRIHYRCKLFCLQRGDVATP